MVVYMSQLARLTIPTFNASNFDEETITNEQVIPLCIENTEEIELLYLDTFDGDIIDSKVQILGKYFQNAKKIQLVVKAHFELEPLVTIFTILGLPVTARSGPVFSIYFTNAENQLEELKISITSIISMKFNKRTGTGFVSCLLNLK